MAEEIALGPGTALRVVEETDERLEVEATYAGVGSPPPAHFHPAQEELFEVRSGAMNTLVGGQEGTVRAGETLEIPRGTVHQMWNAGEETAVVSWTTRPAGRTLEWFRVLSTMMRGEASEDPAALLAEYSDVFRLADA